MRVFHTLVFQNSISGTTFTDPVAGTETIAKFVTNSLAGTMEQVGQ